MILHVWKAIDHTVILALFGAIFGTLFCCRLINIFLTQFWTENLLIHKPQPRHTTVTTLTRVTRVTLFTTVIQITIKRPAYRLDFSKARGGP